MPVLGTDVETRQAVVLTPQARRQGAYIIGTTGTGKTTLLQNIAYQDMAAGDGLCVLDPHGDFIDELLLRVPPNREEDVILFAPGENDFFEKPLGLNLLSCDRTDPKERDLVTSTVIGSLYKLFYYSWGPRMEDLLRHSVLTLMEIPDTTFLELLLLLASQDHRDRFVAHVSDPVLRHFWEVQFASYSKSTRVEVVGSSLNKIGRFLANSLIRNIIAQPENAFDLSEIMDNGKILLVNLSKGDLGEDNSSLLGSVLVNQILIAALRRRAIPPDRRRTFHLIVDEYQSFATQSFPTLQSEARKYGIDVIVAHQFRDQLDDLNKGSTLNVANFIVMRVSGKDSHELASQFDNTPPPPDTRMEAVYQRYDVGDDRVRVFTSTWLPTGEGSLFHEVEQPRRPYSDVEAETANRLSVLPNRHAICRLVDREVLAEASIQTIEPMGEKNPAVAQSVRDRSLALGIPRSVVEADIKQRIGREVAFDDWGDVPFFDPQDT